MSNFQYLPADYVLYYRAITREFFVGMIKYIDYTPKDGTVLYDIDIYVWDQEKETIMPQHVIKVKRESLIKMSSLLFSEMYFKIDPNFIKQS